MKAQRARQTASKSQLPNEIADLFQGQTQLRPMLVKIKTYFLLGIDAMPVNVGVDLSPATLPKTVIVGLPEQADRENIHRIERALVNGASCVRTIELSLT